MAGRLLSKLFGGINANATRLNIGDTEAESIINFDLGLDGAITRRLGCERVQSLGTPFCHIGKFNAEDGTEQLVAIANNKVWRSSGGAAFTDVTGSVTLTADSGYVGAAFGNRYFITNGTDKPIYVEETGNADTMENGSRLPNVTGVEGFAVNPSAATEGYLYQVLAVTPRGRTNSSNPPGVAVAGALVTFSAVAYNIVSWTPVPGASAHEIYCATSVGGQTRGSVTSPVLVYAKVGEVNGTTATWNDYGLDFMVDENGYAIWPPPTNTAYLTPGDWNTNGQPDGFAPIARGRDARLLAWRDNTVWASGLSDGLNWLTPNDAFIFTINAARDNRINAIGSVHDYTMISTRTDSFFYSGASAGTITMEKVIPVGCMAHNSIVTVGDDLLFISQYGPTTLKRVMSGADISNTTSFNNKIQPLFFATNRDQWNKITSYVMPAQNRVVWWIPGSEQTNNTYGLVYQYDINAWSSYADWTPTSTVVAVDGTVYGGMTDGGVYTLHTGYSDNGSAISASYKTGHMDVGSWEPRKRIPWVDIIADRSGGNYSFDVAWNFDMGRQSWGPVTCATTTTGGSTVIVTSTTTTQHRVYTTGIGNTVQLEFTADAVGTPVKIIGYETEVRGLGKR